MEIVDKDRFDELVQGDKLLVVDFFANWCMPCKMLSPVLDALAEKYTDQITVVKVDVDESSDLAKSFGILSIPCVIVFKQGAEADRIIGFTQLDDICTIIDNNL